MRSETVAKHVHLLVDNLNKYTIMNKTTKSKKPAYFVYVNDIETLSDIDVAFGIAKQESGLPMSAEEFDAIIDFTVKETVASLLPPTIFMQCINCETKVKKQPWYKRAWKKIKGIFTR